MPAGHSGVTGRKIAPSPAAGVTVPGQWGNRAPSPARANGSCPVGQLSCWMSLPK